MKRTKEDVQKEIAQIRANHHNETLSLARTATEQITQLEAELKALDQRVQAKDIVAGAKFRSKYNTELFIVQTTFGQYLMGGLRDDHPCSLYSDAPRSLGELLEYLNGANEYKKVPGEVKFIEGPVQTKVGDILDCISYLSGTRIVRMYPDNSVWLEGPTGNSCNTYESLADLNAALDGRDREMYRRRV